MSATVADRLRRRRFVGSVQAARPAAVSSSSDCEIHVGLLASGHTSRIAPGMIADQCMVEARDAAGLLTALQAPPQSVRQHRSWRHPATD
jgi:hypothetical protein